MVIYRTTYLPVELTNSVKDTGDLIMKVMRSKRPTWLGRLMSYPEIHDTIEFVGYSTIWYSLPHFERCDYAMEQMLAGFFKCLLHKYGRP